MHPPEWEGGHRQDFHDSNSETVSSILPAPAGTTDCPDQSHQLQTQAATSVTDTHNIQILPIREVEAHTTPPPPPPRPAKTPPPPPSNGADGAQNQTQPLTPSDGGSGVCAAYSAQWEEAVGDSCLLPPPEDLEDHDSWPSRSAGFPPSAPASSSSLVSPIFSPAPSPQNNSHSSGNSTNLKQLPIPGRHVGTASDFLRPQARTLQRLPQAPSGGEASVSSGGGRAGAFTSDAGSCSAHHISSPDKDWLPEWAPTAAQGKPRPRHPRRHRHPDNSAPSRGPSHPRKRTTTATSKAVEGRGKVPGRSGDTAGLPEPRLSDKASRPIGSDPEILGPRAGLCPGRGPNPIPAPGQPRPMKHHLGRRKPRSLSRRPEERSWASRGAETEDHLGVPSWDEEDHYSKPSETETNSSRKGHPSGTADGPSQACPVEEASSLCSPGARGDWLPSEWENRSCDDPKDAGPLDAPQIDVESTPPSPPNSWSTPPRGSEGKIATDGSDKAAKRKARRCGLSCWGFPFCCVNCPVLAAMIMVLLVPVVLVLLWPGIEVSTDFDSFLEADSPANDIRAVFLKALPFRGNLETLRRRLTSEVTLNPDILHKIHSLRLLYRARTPKGLLTYDALAMMRRVELGVRDLPGWRRLCGERVTPVLRILCEPGYSLANIAWPDQEAVDTQGQPRVTYNLTGRGLEPLPLQALVAIAVSKGYEEVIFPVDFNSSKPIMVLRTQFEFNLACCMVYDSMHMRSSSLSELSRLYNQFIKDDLYPMLLEFNKNDLVEVFYEGSVIDSHEMWVALKGDLLWAFGSVIFITLYLTVHTRSFFVSSFALSLVMLAIPTAFVTSALLSGGNRVTGASFLSLFLMVGLGADVVLVFITFWEMSRHHEATGASRIWYLYRSAGISCLATSMTTAASFFANLASVLRPLREFGFFMGLCILYTYVFLLIGLPALFVTKERCCERRTSRCGKVGLLLRIGHLLPRSLRIITKSLPCPSFRELLTLYIERVIVPFHRTCSSFFALVLLVFACWTALASELDSGIPAMFPPGHNQHDIPAVRAQFSGGSVLPWWTGSTFSICNLNKESLDRPSSLCELSWCSVAGEAPPLEVHGWAPASTNKTARCRCEVAEVESAQCTLQRNKAGAVIESGVHFVGLDEESVPRAFWSSSSWREHMAEVAFLANGGPARLDSVVPIRTGLRAAGKVVQEHWESGLVQIADYTIGPQAQVALRNDSRLSRFLQGQFCEVSQVCYCGTPSCRLSHELPSMRLKSLSLEVPVSDGDRRRLGSLEADGGGHSLYARPPQVMLHGRRLDQGSSDVSLVWGLRVLHTAPLLGQLPEDSWGFSPEFRPESPSVQRHLLASCRSDKEVLLVRSKTCWPEEFRNFVHQRNLMFPVRATHFPTLLLQFARGNVLPTGTAVKDVMWFSAEGTLRATVAAFHVAVSYTATSSTDIIAYKVHWDNHVAQLSYDAPMDAGKLWHTSRLWIRAEAETAIIGSTVNTMVVSIGCGFFGALCFTHGDLGLSSLVVISVLGVTVSLAWFMTVIMNWKTGAVEVLGLIVFVGYSLTYSLHIAHKYREEVRKQDLMSLPAPVRRREAVTHALRSMTSAVVGSAVTTLGSSFFLFFCTIRIFMKLATVLFAVTFFAAVFAIAALPAALTFIGPLGMCGCDGLMLLLARLTALASRPVSITLPTPAPVPEKTHDVEVDEDCADVAAAPAVSTHTSFPASSGISISSVSGCITAIEAEDDSEAQQVLAPQPSTTSGSTAPVALLSSGLQVSGGALALSPPQGTVTTPLPLPQQWSLLDSTQSTSADASPSLLPSRLFRGRPPARARRCSSPGGPSTASTMSTSSPIHPVGPPGAPKAVPTDEDTEGETRTVLAGSWPGKPTGGGQRVVLRPPPMAAAEAHADGDGALVGGGVRTNGGALPAGKAGVNIVVM